jgi:hypothetical protein
LAPFQIKRLIDNRSLSAGAGNTLIACNSRLTSNGHDSSMTIGQLDQRSGRNIKLAAKSQLLQFYPMTDASDQSMAELPAAINGGEARHNLRLPLESVA